LSDTETTFKFNDEVIAHVAKLLQLAIISGTDIVDHMRMVELVEQEGQLYLTPEYSQRSEANIEKMIQEISEQ
jgi:hypothetical protein